MRQADPQRLMEMAWGYAAPVIVATAVEHRVFDHLEERPRTLEELRALTGTSARGLRILLRALVGLELVEWRHPHYALTAESAAFLVRGQPGYRGGLFGHHVGHLLPQWQQLSAVVRTGRPAVRTNREGEGAAHFAGFVEALFPGSYPTGKVLGEHLGLGTATGPVNVLDLGAGSGVWGIALAEMSSAVRVRAVDWPAVIEITRRTAARFGVADRFSFVEGDYFEVDLGADHDVAVLGHILHSEGPARVQQVLGRVRDALRVGGVVAIQEFLPNDDRTGPLVPLLFAVNMLVNTEEGDTYTFAEISRWLGDCGFVRTRCLEVPGVSPLILANRG